MAPKKVQKKTVRRKKKSSMNQPNLRSEVVGIILVAFGILLSISVFSKNSAGPFGELLGRITGGFFGLSGYAVPVLVIIHGLFKIFKPKYIYEDKRFVLVIILLVLFSSMFQAGLHDVSYYENMNLGRYISTFYREGMAAVGRGQEFLPSGGILGGVVGVPLLFVFRKLGTMIILVTLSIIVGMLITRLSLAEAARSVARGTSEAINGMVGAARKKIAQRSYQRTFEENSDSDTDVPKRKKKAKIVDFCLDKPEQTPNAPAIQEEYKDSERNFAAEANDINIEEKADNEAQGPEIVIAPSINNEEDKDIEQNVKADLEVPDFKAPEAEPSAAAAVVKEEPVAEEAINVSAAEKREKYVYPPYELLSRSKEGESNLKRIKTAAAETAKKLEDTLSSFGIGAKVINVSVGPAFTRYELQPAPGVKVSRIVNLTDDIALNLAASGIRIEAPIPGKAAIGVEVPNKEVAPINIRSVIESPEFQNHPSKLAVALGKDISGENTVVDLAKMPHILIAGATGSGKSVCINSIVVSLLYKASPDEVKLLMIDPKVVELGVYNGIPHLLVPVVTDPNKAAGALRWAVSEMTTRYKLFAERGVRDLMGYNASVEETGEGMKLPEIVIIIDELADLMMVAPNDVEDSICRLAQMARAAGMHLVIATQRPSVNVITGVIKANIPSRIAFAVSSQVDSRTILDMAGAEKLLGKGDMLYYPVGIPKPIRVKGVFVSDKEVELVVDFVKNQVYAHYDEEIIENINDNSKNEEDSTNNYDCDELLNEAIEAVIDCGQASVSFIQRKFKVGYARAGRIIDQMAERNIISGYEGSKPRRVLISRERWEEMKMSSPGDGV